MGLQWGTVASLIAADATIAFRRWNLRSSIAGQPRRGRHRGRVESSWGSGEHTGARDTSKGEKKRGRQRQVDQWNKGGSVRRRERERDYVKRTFQDHIVLQHGSV